MTRPIGVLSLLALLSVLTSPHHQAIAASKASPGVAATARAQAPIDLTGTWISVVTEDWLSRMMTPAKGDVTSVPVNDAARKAAAAWDPAADEDSDAQCRAYGAAAVMRMPGRVRISWADENTLQIETEAGAQTRLLRFNSSPQSREPTWQGASKAAWELSRGRSDKGSLRVVTNNLRPGYLRKNGVPYSGDALVTEFIDVLQQPEGDAWLLVATTVTDPTYLLRPFVTSTHFKKVSGTSEWKPERCSSR